MIEHFITSSRGKQGSLPLVPLCRKVNLLWECSYHLLIFSVSCVYHFATVGDYADETHTYKCIHIHTYIHKHTCSQMNKHIETETHRNKHRNTKSGKQTHLDISF